MPKILIVAATPFETEATARHFNLLRQAEPHLMSTAADSPLQLSLLVTGVGMVNTAYALGRCAANFDYVINAGIAGAFDRGLALGQVVLVTEDILSELGAEDGDAFLQYPELKLGGTHIYHQTLLNPVPFLNTLTPVRGITVNKVHGRDSSIEVTAAIFKPQVESMEGAAFFRGAAHFNATCLQVRAISNYVERRDKSKWNIPLALASLNNYLIQLINHLQS